MAKRASFGKKLAKFRRAPKRFLADSSNPALRALGAIVPGTLDADVRRIDKLELSDPREVIDASGLFDAPYYLTTYPDVRRFVGAPLDHYMKYGVTEGRRPNPLFDPHYYVRRAGILLAENPLAHYAKVGEAKGLLPHPRFDPGAYRERYPDVKRTQHGLLEHFLKIGQKEGRRAHPPARHVPGELHQNHDLRTVAVTIIVPVFNGFEHVRRCIEAVLAHTRLPDVELLLIDDASTDPLTSALLADYARLPRVTRLHNAQNLGFTRTVNRGLEHARGRDVVLLNSDTVVGPRWLEPLVLAAYGGPRVATATALSDNAGAFSTPQSGVNHTATFCPVQDAARLSQRAAPCTAQLVPTGNGFCMFMRHDALAATGNLDDVNFPRGYGEENDWCMRASEQGFVHAIAFRSYVHHVNAVSFGSEAKAHLRDQARATLDRLHPDYGALVRRAFGPEVPLQAQRKSLGDELEQLRRSLISPPRPRVLFVVSTLTGGTPMTNEDLMRGVSHLFEPFLLICDSREMQLLDCGEGGSEIVASHKLSETLGFVPHTSSEYDAVIGSWLAEYGIELLHVRHIAWHSLGLVRVAKRQGIPVVFSLHDFYTVDPSVNLTNGTDRWFERGVTSPHIISPLWTRRDAPGVETVQQGDPEAFLALWKRRMNSALSECDAFVTTSPFARRVFAQNLPILAQRSSDFHVIPHGRDFEHFLAPPTAPRARKPLRVLLPGNITESKGLLTILEILRLDEHGEIEFHLVGTTRDSLRDHPRLQNHGAYARKDFGKLVSKIKPHVGLIISIWPETFCHTLTECWAAGVPVVGSDLGAVGERILESGAGWAVDPFDASGILALLRRIQRGEDSWSQKVDALTRWRQTTAEWDVDAMAARYVDVYLEVLHRERPLLPGKGLRGSRARKRIALVVRGHYPFSMPTSHVRIATQVGQARGDVDYDWIEGGELVRSGVASFDGIVICRNAGAGPVFLELIRQCRESAVPIVFDLDDDLLNVPASKDPGGVYPAFAPAMRELLDTASLVSVSTEPLRELYDKPARSVRIVPNKLDPRRWFEPLTGEPVVLSELQESDTFRIIYMGSPTHREDLQLILPAFARLREKHDVTLYIVGIVYGGGIPDGVIPIKPPNARYDQFIAWFRAIAPNFDAAVAPLVDAPFNLSKSALKFMEYAAAGLPVVASRVGPYPQLVQDGVDGLLADNDDDSWFAAVSSLVTDAELRRSLTEAARARAEREFACRSCVFDDLPWEQWSAALAAATPEADT